MLAKSFRLGAIYDIDVAFSDIVTVTFAVVQKYMEPIETYAFFLVPGFSALAFFSAIEPLRVANRLSPNTLFAWRLFSSDGDAVEASNGMRVMVDGPLDETAPVLTICAGFEPKQGERPGLLAALRRMARAGAVLGAMDTGAYALARAFSGELERLSLLLRPRSVSRSRRPLRPPSKRRRRRRFVRTSSC